MTGEDPVLARYRRFVTAFVLVGSVLAAVVGGYLLWTGRAFFAFVALLCTGFFVLIAHGYRQDAEERRRGSGGG